MLEYASSHDALLISVNCTGSPCFLTANLDVKGPTYSARALETKLKRGFFMFNLHKTDMSVLESQFNY